jgi:hypothetical protein
MVVEESKDDGRIVVESFMPWFFEEWTPSSESAEESSGGIGESISWPPITRNPERSAGHIEHKNACCFGFLQLSI